VGLIPRDVVSQVPRVVSARTGGSRPPDFHDLVNHCRHRYTNYEQLLGQHAGDRGEPSQFALTVYLGIKARCDEAVRAALGALGIGEADFLGAEEPGGDESGKLSAKG
jgi:hypothetical protein